MDKDGQRGRGLDRSGLDEHAYLDGKIQALTAVIAGMMHVSAIGGAEAFDDFLEKVRKAVRSEFDGASESNKREAMAGADEVLKWLQASINSE